MSGVLSTDRNSLGKQRLCEFTQGVAIDARLYRQEIRVQLAWARMLTSIKVLSGTEFQRAESALMAAQSEIESGKFNWRIEDEDIHMNLERFVTEKEGELGKKIHLGRSRNDLIATTLRLFVADSLDEIKNKVSELAQTAISRASEFSGAAVPGCTHMQNGQPLYFGHILGSYAWMLLRDLKRLKQARESALESMPLGSAALSGSPLLYDEQALASALGFNEPSFNSYDSVGDRDFMVQALDAISMTGVHLSRMAEDFVIWASTGVGLVKLPPEWSTGSSIMPNKRNPDVPELVRGKSAHMIAAANEARALVKGLPTSYQSDLHELKQVYLRASDELALSLGAFTSFLATFSLNSKRASELLATGHLLATEIADHLVGQGLSFRDAYKQVAALVERAESLGVQVEKISVDVALSLAPKVDPQFLKNLSYESAIARRIGIGGTSQASLTKQLEAVKARLSR